MSTTRARRSTSPNGTRSWIWVVFAVFGIAWGGNQFTPLLTMYRSHGLDAVFVDVLLFVYALGIAPALLIGGPLSDRYGRKPVMLLGPVLAIAGSVFLAIGASVPVLLFIGRFLAGAAVGLAMSVGGSWVKELSQAPFDPDAAPTSGAKRQAMAQTAGFGIGAGVASILAQWLPLPDSLPYAVHVIVTVPTIIALLVVPETRQSAHLHQRGSFWSDVATPSVLHPRFLTVVALSAPWVFGCAGVAYAILPNLMTDLTSVPIAFSGLMTVVGLGAGFIIQQVGPRFVNPASARGTIIAMVLVIAGMSMATWVAGHLSIAGGLAAAAVLGLGYGLTMFTGLNEVQRIAGPVDLAGLTGVFYALSYIGFAFPAILAELSGSGPELTYPLMLGFGVVVAALSLVVIIIRSRKDIPGAEPATVA